MNEWQIKYIYNGNYTDYVFADSLEAAMRIWRSEHENIPAIALYSVECSK